jgi:multidrug efflux pump subunit AcrA (membrane-fusion protein)
MDLKKNIFVCLSLICPFAMASIPVHTVPVIKKNLPDTIRSTGSIVGTVLSYVQTEVSGQILQLKFKPGQAIKKGEVVAVIDPTLSKATLAEAQAQQKRLADLISGQETVVTNLTALYAGQATTKTQLQAEGIKLKELRAQQIAAKANVIKRPMVIG